MSVEELVKRLRHSDEYEPLGHDGWEAADKLEELAAENERWRERRRHWRARAIDAEATLAEKDKEIDWQRLCDVINAANRVSARTGKEHVTDANELREFALARNAGGNDAE